MVAKINSHFSDATQHNGGYVFDVKKYGAVGTGSGGAASDQAGFSGAIAAANAAAYGGVVYIPTGEYYVTGPFTLDNEVSIIGAGSPQVTINHSGNNSLFSATTWALDRYKTFQGFKLIGNSGASARGITVGNAWGPRFYDLFITTYDGTDGRGINFYSDTHWCEGVDIDHVMIRACKRCVSCDGATAGNGSFSDFRIQHANLVPEIEGGVGLYLGSNAGIYSGSLNLRLHTDNVPTSSGIYMAAGSQMIRNFYQVYWEGGSTDPGKFITTEANTKISGHGQLYPLGSPYDIFNALDATTKIFLGPYANAASSHQSGGTYTSFRGSGNSATLHPFGVNDPDTVLAGQGVVYGDNVASPVVFMYGGRANAFQVIKVSPGVKPAAGTVLLEVDVAGHVRLGTGGPRIFTGTGAPSNNSLPVGSLYLRKDGGAGTSLYVKESATTWAPK
jgi:hypothetical protein